MMRSSLAAAMAALGLAALPSVAAAGQTAATLSCADGVHHVVASDHGAFAALRDTGSRAVFVPVAFHLVFDGHAVDVAKKGAGRERTETCGYSDATGATGTVEVQRSAG